MESGLTCFYLCIFFTLDYLSVFLSLFLFEVSDSQKQLNKHSCLGSGVKLQRLFQSEMGCILYDACFL